MPLKNGPSTERVSVDCVSVQPLCTTRQNAAVPLVQSSLLSPDDGPVNVAAATAQSRVADLAAWQSLEPQAPPPRFTHRSRTNQKNVEQFRDDYEAFRARCSGRCSRPNFHRLGECRAAGKHENGERRRAIAGTNRRLSRTSPLSPQARPQMVPRRIVLSPQRRPRRIDIHRSAPWPSAPSPPVGKQRPPPRKALPPLANAKRARVSL